jgi:hypothetical protein
MKAERLCILIRDPLENLEDLLGVHHLLLELIVLRVQVLPLHHDLNDGLPVDLVRLLGLTSIKRLLTTPLHLAAELVHHLPALLARVLLRENGLDSIAVAIDQELGTPPAHTLQDLLHVIKELDVEHRLREIDVAKVARTKRVLVLTGMTHLVVINHSHAWIEKAIDNGILTDVGIGLCDLSHRHLADLSGTEDAKTDALDLFDVILIREFLIEGHVYLLKQIILK